ncbi:MAG: DNA replication/repair protein RecF [Acidobacteriota bacterium]
MPSSEQQLAVVSVAVKNVRCHASYAARLEPHKTIITGANGSGKTSLAEAVYIALRGTTFRGTDADVIRHGAEWFRVDLTLTDGQTRSAIYRTDQQSKREYLVNGKKMKRLGFRDKLPVVLFDPTDLQLISGSPSRRRRYLDQILSQSDPLYSRELSRYEKSVRQRNSLLKRQASAEQLFPWNVMIAQHGAYIYAQRWQLVGQLQQQINQLYSDIAGASDDISLHYSGQVAPANYQSYLLRQLEQSAERDGILGYTSHGPHRDDLAITFNGRAADATASRGEARSIIVALKHIELEIVHAVTGIVPLLILDDVFSELDTQRQLSLERLTNRYQTIITTTHLSDGSDTSIQRQLS